MPDSIPAASSPRRPERTFFWTAVCVLAGAWLVCLAPFAFRGELPGRWHDDTNICFIPYREYLIRTVGAGRFPDLAAGSFLGQPMMTYGQPMLLYPTVFLGVVFPVPPTAFFLSDLWLHGVLASLGFALFLRGRGASPFVALALGWAYPNTTAFLFRALGHWTLLHQIALLPWLLWAWDRLAHARRGRDFAAVTLLALPAAWMLMCRTPHYPYLLAVALLPSALVRLGRGARKSGWHVRRWVGLPLLALALAILLAAPDVFPPAFGLGDSFREVVADGGLSRHWPLSRVNLVGLVSPLLLFGEAHDEFFGNWWPGESALFAGRAVWVLALVGLAAMGLRPRRHGARGATGLVFVAVGLLFGAAPEFPTLHRAMVVYVPLYDMLRCWGRAGALVVVGLLILAAVGFEAVRKSNRTARRAAWIGAGACALLAALLIEFRLALADETAGGVGRLVALGWEIERFAGGALALEPVLSSMRERLRTDILAYLVLGGLFAARALVPLADGGSRSARRSDGWRSDGWRNGGWGRTVRAASMAGLALVVAVEAFAFQRFVWNHSTKPLSRKTLGPMAETLERLRDAVAPEPLTLVTAERELVNVAMLFEGVRGLSGADSNLRKRYGLWLNRVQMLPETTSQLSTQFFSVPPAMIETSGLSVVVERLPHQPPVAGIPRYHAVEIGPRIPYAELLSPWDLDFGVRCGPPTPPEALETRRWLEGEAAFLVRTDAPSVLRVREFPDPRWRATVNGKDVAPEWRDETLVIRLPPGEHRVEIRYIDRAARLSTILAVVAWLTLAAVAVVKRRRRIPPLSPPHAQTAPRAETPVNPQT